MLAQTGLDAAAQHLIEKAVGNNDRCSLPLEHILESYEKLETGKIMKSSKRALRRHQKARVKAKARRIYPHDRAAKSADYLAVCSCWMCGNPRKWYGELTMQERKASLDEGVM